MEDYVKEFIAKLTQEEPIVQVSTIETVKKKISENLDERILADKEKLSKLEATVSRLKDE